MSDKVEEVMFIEAEEIQLRKIGKVSVTDLVVEELRRSIKSGNYKVGDKLQTEGEICRQLGVSRSTVREALRILQTTGMIVIHHGRGAFISSAGMSPAMILNGLQKPD